MEFPRKGGAGIRPIQNKLFPDENPAKVSKTYGTPITTYTSSYGYGVEQTLCSGVTKLNYFLVVVT